MVYHLPFCKRLVADGVDSLSTRTLRFRKHSAANYTEYWWEDYSTLEKAYASPIARRLILGISGLITEAFMSIVTPAISLSLSLVTHILISVIFKLASRKSTTSEFSKATILCLDVMAFAVGEIFRSWIVLRYIMAGEDHFWKFLVELGRALMTAPIYIFIMRVFLMQLSLPGPYHHKSLRRISIWTGSLILTTCTILYLNCWKQIKATNGADTPLTINRIGEVRFITVWFILAVTILTSTITILRTHFVEQGLLYGYHSYLGLCRSGAVWIPFVGTWYREDVRLRRKWASQHLANLQPTNEEYQIAL